MSNNDHPETIEHEGKIYVREDMIQIHLRDGRIPVLVTTKDRGVYFGYASPEDLDKKDQEHLSMDLINCRHLYYWAAQPDGSREQGLQACATIGPARGSKVGPPVERQVRDVATIMKVSRQATKRWDECSWEN
jgi:hypothetical protein